ncbi:unnamed protein product [Bemisia tabaci]|uniref:Uncharacterized protein n=1 Tax=Bemisia tabaci TaxID=7038 RepID=A0A9P0A6A1_BEMTA|nr:unnamed protein product [Bemisia tabaci]
MPRIAASLLLFAIVISVIFSEIEGPGSPRSSHPGRQSRSRSRSPNRFQNFVASVRRSISPSRGNGNGQASSSRGRAPSGPPPPPDQGPFLPSATTIVLARKGEGLELYQEFLAKRAQEGNMPASVTVFQAMKDSLLRMADSDTCSWDPNAGETNCRNALDELRKIHQSWRGPCGQALASVCHNWIGRGGGPRLGPTCSLFMQTKPRKRNGKVEGIVHPLRDCVKALSPAEYGDSLRQADSWLNFP